MDRKESTFDLYRYRRSVLITLSFYSGLCTWVDRERIFCSDNISKKFLLNDNNKSDLSGLIKLKGFWNRRLLDRANLKKKKKKSLECQVTRFVTSYHPTTPHSFHWLKTLMATESSLVKKSHHSHLQTSVLTNIVFLKEILRPTFSSLLPRYRLPTSESFPLIKRGGSSTVGIQRTSSRS